jgi:hypothetical protein
VKINPNKILLKIFPREREEKRNRTEKHRKQTKTKKIADSFSILKIILNVNCLNTSLKD